MNVRATNDLELHCPVMNDLWTIAPDAHALIFLPKNQGLAMKLRVLAETTCHDQQIYRDLDRHVHRGAPRVGLM